MSQTEISNYRWHSRPNSPGADSVYVTAESLQHSSDSRPRASSSKSKVPVNRAQIPSHHISSLSSRRLTRCLRSLSLCRIRHWRGDHAEAVPKRGCTRQATIFDPWTVRSPLPLVCSLKSCRFSVPKLASLSRLSFTKFIIVLSLSFTRSCFNCGPLVVRTYEPQHPGPY